MDDWIVAQTDCAACDGSGVWALLGSCPFCGSTGTIEYEGPDVTLNPNPA